MLQTTSILILLNVSWVISISKISTGTLSENHAPIGSSDHAVITFKYHCFFDYVQPSTRYAYDKADYNKIREHLQQGDENEWLIHIPGIFSRMEYLISENALYLKKWLEFLVGKGNGILQLNLSFVKLLN